MKNLPYTAETDIEGYRLVTFGTNDGEVKPTTAKTDPVIGVTNYIGAPAGTTVDVNVDNVGKVKLSGTVAAGDASAAGDRVFGMALQDGADGDVIEFLKK